MKICGLSNKPSIAAAAEGGAAYIGFVFYEKSPRFVSLDEASELSAYVPPGICKVALTVDATDAELDALLASVGIDMLQLQGRESPERVAEVKARTGLPVMKALGVSEASDLAKIDVYAGIADQLLVDAKPPKGARLPGGNGVAFDWQLITGRRWSVPWMLAGGLTAENVGRAVKLTGAQQVDLSSAVETAPGVKDPTLIRAFLAAVSEEVPAL